MDLDNYGIKPFLVELATGDKSICDTCYRNIANQELRITRLTKLEERKGYFPYIWYHIECYLPERLPDQPPPSQERCRPFPTSMDEIEGLDLLELQNSKNHLWLKNRIASLAFARADVPSKVSKIGPLEPPNYKYSKRMVKLTMKDDFVMDSNALWQGLELKKTTHILKENGKTYGETLCRVDLDSGCNAFYKVQILESDKITRRYFIFRSWGRIGESNESRYLCDEMTLKQQAIEAFEGFIKDLTYFQYTVMDIDYGEVKMISSKPSIKLEPQLEKFIRKIFDVPPETFDFDFEMDVKQNPLGKMSPTQLSKAYQILANLTELVDEQESGNGDLNEENFHRKVVEIMNSYLTLVPRQFSVDEPPLLKTSDVVQGEVDSLENLMELDLHLQFSPEQPMMHSLYKTLNCDIVVVAKDSELWGILEKYLFNTIVDNEQWTLTLDNIYSVARRGEHELFSKSKHVGNRKLLWHGSPTANIRGILSNGLGLSSHHGYGSYNYTHGTSQTTIFFADMASKSTWYCKPSPENNTGALLLSEVALGTLAANAHSFVPTATNIVGSSYNFIQGTNIPDPNDYHTLPGGVVVPWGKAVNRNGGSLASYGYGHFNEYIVYDKAQVNLQFLLEVTFNYKQPANAGRKN